MQPGIPGRLETAAAGIRPKRCRARRVNTGHEASLVTVSCSSPGDCTATGGYATSSSDPAVCDQRNGRPVGPGDAGAAPGHPQRWPSGRRCLAVVRLGWQLHRRRLITANSPVTPGPDVVSQLGGQWRNALQIPGTSWLGRARVTSVSWYRSRQVLGRRRLLRPPKPCAGIRRQRELVRSTRPGRVGHAGKRER